MWLKKKKQKHHKNKTLTFCTCTWNPFFLPGPEEASNLAGTADSERAQRIIRENGRLKARVRCKICREANVGMIFLPCGHIVTCTQCGSKTRNCNSCGQFIRATANVYMSWTSCLRKYPRKKISEGLFGIYAQIVQAWHFAGVDRSGQKPCFWLGYSGFIPTPVDPNNSSICLRFHG